MPRSGTPNILLLFCDQLRADALGAYGNRVIRTPNIDAIAAHGVRFDSAFTPCPVCIGARCSMIYGQYPHNTGCYENTPMPTDGRGSFMHGLAEAGYRTHGIGKCHFSPDAQALRGFDTRERQEELVSGPDADDYLQHLHANGFQHVCDPHGIRGEMYYIPQPSQLPEHLHPTQWIGDRSVAFIECDERRQQPWFLFSSFVHPHPPFAPPNPWHKLYRAPLMPLPNLPPDYGALQTYINRHQNRYKYRDQGLDLNLIRCLRAYYFACVSFIDYQVGRIMAALEKSGQLEHTLVLFTADHGEMLGDYNCFGKRSMHDAAARIPLLARLPGRFEPAAACSTPASLVDIAPTVLATGRAAVESHPLDGVDLADIAAGASRRETVFAQISAGRGASETTRARSSTYMAVSQRWKYFYSAPDDREFLFDRVQDLGETRNRAGLHRFAECSDACSTMRQTLFEHLQKGGETAGIDGDDWKHFPPMTMPADPDAGLLVQDHAWAQTHIEGYSDGHQSGMSPL